MTHTDLTHTGRGSPLPHSRRPERSEGPASSFLDRARATGVAILVAAITVLAPAAHAQAEVTLTPVRQRTSDAVLARDYATMTGAQARLLAVRRRLPALPQYPFEKAQRWLSLARESYEMNSPGTLPGDALRQATLLMTQLDAGRVPPLLQGTQPLPVGVPVRPDLWRLADSLRNSGQVERIAAELASLELSLVRSGLVQAKVLACPGENPEREAERSAIRAAAILVRDPAVAAGPARVDTVFVERAVAAARATPVRQRDVPATLTGVPPNVHFAYNADTLSGLSKRVLDAAADSLLLYAQARVTLSGNTDSRGNAAYNEALSRRRATRVREYLISRGVDGARVTIQALGAGNLKVAEAGAVDLARNRRVDITYVASDGRVIETREGLSDLQVEAALPPRRPGVRARPAKP